MPCLDKTQRDIKKSFNGSEISIAFPHWIKYEAKRRLGHHDKKYYSIILYYRFLASFVKFRRPFFTESPL